eukprot:GEMP01020431.1.p1 GENE.GEMP01020431.1~~GEMP01020431.1.p1  ORF type:complete len:548 (+),score=87.14 GEMP01020431.1:77-1645(+)
MPFHCRLKSVPYGESPNSLCGTIPRKEGFLVQDPMSSLRVCRPCARRRAALNSTVESFDGSVRGGRDHGFPGHPLSKTDMDRLTLRTANVLSEYFDRKVRGDDVWGKEPALPGQIASAYERRFDKKGNTNLLYHAESKLSVWNGVCDMVNRADRASHFVHPANRKFHRNKPDPALIIYFYTEKGLFDKLIRKGEGNGWATWKEIEPLLTPKGRAFGPFFMWDPAMLAETAIKRDIGAAPNGATPAQTLLTMLRDGGSIRQAQGQTTLNTRNYVIPFYVPVKWVEDSMETCWVSPIPRPAVEDWNSRLIEACHKRDLDLVITCQRNGARANYVDQRGWTPLHATLDTLHDAMFESTEMGTPVVRFEATKPPALAGRSEATAPSAVDDSSTVPSGSASLASRITRRQSVPTLPAPGTEKTMGSTKRTMSTTKKTTATEKTTTSEKRRTIFALLLQLNADPTLTTHRGLSTADIGERRGYSCAPNALRLLPKMQPHVHISRKMEEVPPEMTIADAMLRDPTIFAY